MITALDGATDSWDVLVIGGGATGLSAALEAASRGHRTVLVEAVDFAKGTSSRSTKLIHGGVRYLRQGQIGMVRQSLQERTRLLHNAPHLVQPLELILPADSLASRAISYAGLRVYDLLAGRWFRDRSRWVSSREMQMLLPTLRSEHHQGGVRFFDSQFDDARLAVALAQTAVRQGAVVLNYMPVVRLLSEGGRLSGAVVRDSESQREYPVRARAIINATGVFADRILSMVPPEDGTAGQRPQVVASQGSHLVLDSSFLPGRSAVLIPKTDDGRILFLIPWLGRVLVGTTDLTAPAIEEEPRPLAGEIDYLLEHASRYLVRPPRESDIRSRFSGLRPLVGHGSGTATSRLSREHELFVSASGLITVLGGKWTTCRRMGEDLIDRAEHIGGLPRRRSITATLSLVPPHAEVSRAASCDQSGEPAGDPELHEIIHRSPELAGTIHPRLTDPAAMVVRAVRSEMARTVEDVLARRSRALFLDARAAEEAAPLTARLLAAELHRDANWEWQQIASFRQVSANY